MNEDFNIESFLDLRNYADKRTDRRKGSCGTQEFFTPYCLVKRMADKVTEDMWYDPTKTFLEPSCGNGLPDINIFLSISNRKEKVVLFYTYDFLNKKINHTARLSDGIDVEVVF